MKLKNFNKDSWVAKCERANKEASKGCGLSDVLYQDRFNQLLDKAINALPNRHHKKAILIAKKMGYQPFETTEEIENTSDINFDSRICSHGIDIDCCPAGCGEI
ncbi:MULTISPECIES: hypothetical protein [Providencia]|nr:MULTISPECIES: hypothetical protein [Providencia]HAZ8239577.1 hypothetical protein [Escherichia coli]EMD1719221.1 hypothetical protein [Providencia stuartii]MBG5909818.1 hypothetical protein [Providencia stuartii]MBG5937445.1 hypothetical protein [Providencia stuartii]MBK1422319.1 hypothetical protein [Providencia stuartii]